MFSTDESGVACVLHLKEGFRKWGQIGEWFFVGQGGLNLFLAFFDDVDANVIFELVVGIALNTVRKLIAEEATVHVGAAQGELDAEQKSY